VNFVMLRVVLFALQEQLNLEGGRGFADDGWLVFSLIISCHGVVFVWQAVGVLRAAEHHVSGSGARFPVWGTQLSLVVATFWVISYGLEAWQMTQVAPDDLPSQAEVEAARAAKYRIDYIPETRQLVLVGSLELGVTAHLKTQLDAFPDAEQIILSSAGGNIYEARGLANTIRLHGLEAVVVSSCRSACTIAFIGGVQRTLARGAELGFHQYRIDADYVVLNANPQLEQERDRAMFRQAGVAEWFLNKMFEHVSSEMWYPTLPELLRAGVVTDVGKVNPTP
jgi:hypothetical protein